MKSVKQNFTINGSVVELVCEDFMGYKVFAKDDGPSDQILYFTQKDTVRGSIKVSADASQNVGVIDDIEFIKE